MKREIIKIQSGNETTLSIRALLPDGKTQVPIYPFGTQSAFRVSSVHFTINGHETESVSYAVKDGLLVVTLPSTLPVAKYGIHVVGSLASTETTQAEPAIDCNFYEVFEIVPYSDNVRYDNYYTDLFIVGLPDTTYEQLRREWEVKIAEAEAAKQEAVEKSEEYVEKVLELDDLIGKLGGVVMMTDAEYAPALADLDSKLV